MLLALIAVLAAAFGLCVAFVLAKWIGSCDAGTDRMKEISGFIREGAFAFLKREYKSMAIVIVVLFIVIGIALDFTTAVLYLFGALLSVLAGFFGMNVATKGNVRTAAAAKDSGMNKALKVAFRSGAVMGLCVSGLGLLGVGLVVTCLDLATVTQCITGFGFGASSMALFGRVGGGIYTKQIAAKAATSDSNKSYPLTRADGRSLLRNLFGPPARKRWALRLENTGSHQPPALWEFFV